MIFLYFIFCVNLFANPTISKCTLKKEVIKNMLTEDSSINAFFKDKTNLSIYDSSNCFDNTFHIDEIKLKPTNNKQQSDIGIIDFEIINDTVALKASFSYNKIYTAKYVLIDNNENIRLIESNVVFMRKPPPKD